MSGSNRYRGFPSLRKGRQAARSKARSRKCSIEHLEDRTVPAVFNVSSGLVSDLVTAVETANANVDPADTINLSGTYTFTQADNYWYGPNALPAIVGDLTINGDPISGALLQRSGAVGTPDFRFFYVAAAQSGVAFGTLNLSNLTLSNGLAKGGDAGNGGGGMGAGGAIFNMGAVNLNGVTIAGGGAVGGGTNVGSGSGGGGIGEDATGGAGGGFGGTAPGAVGGAGGEGNFSANGGGGGFNASDPGGAGPGGGSGNLGGAGSGAVGGDGGGGASSGLGSDPGGSFGQGGISTIMGAGGGGVGGGGGGNGEGAGGGFGGGGGGNAVFGGGGSGGDGGFGGGGGASNPSAGGREGGWGAGASGSQALGNGGGGGGGGMGGAIFNFTGDLTIVNSTIAGNYATGGNSAKQAQAGGGFGGGVFNLNGSVVLVNATFALNTTVSGTGGAQSAVVSNGLDVYSLTFGREWRSGAAFTKGGPVSASVELANSILVSEGGAQNNLILTLDASAKSIGSGGSNTNTATASLDGAAYTNIVYGVTGAFATGGVDDTSTVDLDPAGLADNDGPTPTVALLMQTATAGLSGGSVVFGITIPTVDQRGVVRPASASDVGAFQILLLPSATLDAATTINVAGAAAVTTNVVVTYTDNSGSGIDAATFGLGNITVGNGATVTGFSVSGDVVTYTVTAPAATWAGSFQGEYVISVVAGGVKDLAGNPIAAVADLGSFLVDTVPPTATLTSALAVDAMSSGLATTSIAVTYSDATAGIDPASIGVGNITVGNGATVTGFAVAGGVVTYTVAAPSATWAASAQGVYTVSVVAGGVKDLAGNPIAAVADLGSFLVDTTLPTAVLANVPPVNAASGALATTPLSVAYDGGASGVDPSTFGVGNIIVGNGATVTGFTVVGDVVTYTVAAPTATWAAGAQGTYTVSVVAGSVTDMVGNAIAAASLGSFLVDTVAPTASLTAAPTVTNAAAGASTTTVAVTYSDATAGIDPASIGVGNITVGNGATVTGFAVAGGVVTYTVAAPSATWAASAQGVYTVSVVAGGVKDLAGNPIAAVADLGSFFVATALPTATLASAPTVNAADASGFSTSVSVAYGSGAVGLDPASFGVGNITVGNGATVIGYSVSGNVVTYSVSAPFPTWAASVQGPYAISVVAGSVTDMVGNAIAAASLGSFLVDTVAPTASLTAAPTVTNAAAGASTTTVAVTYSDATAGIDPASIGVGNITVGNGATVTGFAVAGGVVTYTVAAPSATWAASAQGVYTVSVVAGGVKDLAGNPIAAVADLGSFFVATALPTATLASAPTVDNASGGSSNTMISVTYNGGASGIDPSTFGVGNITVGNGATVTGFTVVGDVVTYTVAAPAATWAGSFQGEYVISVVAGGVKDLAGNAIAAVADLGSFLVATALPTATLTAAPPVNAAAGEASTTTVRIAYGGGASGIDPSTFGVGNITVGNGATVTGFTVVGDVVTYTVAAPAATWAGSFQGEYVISVVAGGVKDLAGNAIAAVADLGAIVVDVSVKTATSASVVASPDPAVFGGPITVAATISREGPGPIPTGTVVFRIGETILAEVPIGPNGVAVYTIPAGLAVGAATLTASYSGDALFAPTTSGPVVVVVERSTTASGEISASPSQVFFGQDVTLTAAFAAPSDGVTLMTGTVAFYDGEVFLGSAPIGQLRLAGLDAGSAGASSGFASFTTSSLRAGNHLIRAVYSGDANFSSATSNAPVAVVVAPATTASSLTVAVSGRSATLTSSIVATSPGAVDLTGTVFFYDGDVLIGSAPLVGGAASLSLADLAPGVHDFRAVFSGNADVAQSASGSVSTVIQPNAPLIPSVVNLLRYGFHAQPTTLVLTFSGDVDTSVASNPDRYVVTGPIGPRGVGVRIPVRAATYDPATRSVTLSFNSRLRLQRRFRIAVPSIGYAAAFDGGILAGANRRPSILRRR
ncbi:beta strand repeat-containing protein [Paludisphaera mucosa]|uniref:Ig-like domain repeat protein n=1 Tax=Paludisphaera mucosa TaxID=3030827 RepID=A0ABT6FL92_9BACT|nr:Ig-like domain repeat protein [Paludisphaera mucosa]MDG3008348.1 Ig-like domain repeat protein [Paludisphaera mucosa]